MSLLTYLLSYLLTYSLVYCTGLFVILINISNLGFEGWILGSDCISSRS